MARFKLIADTWEIMLTLSNDIVGSAENRRLLPPLPKPAAEVAVVLTSNTQDVRSNVISQPVVRAM